MPAGCLAATFVVHRLAMKFRPVFSRTLTARGHGPVVAFTEVEMMIDVTVEMTRAVIPRTHPDEYTA
jgi:hypothetical protein